MSISVHTDGGVTEVAQQLGTQADLSEAGTTFPSQAVHKCL